MTASCSNRQANLGGRSNFLFRPKQYLGLLQNEGSLFQNDQKALEINIPTGANSQNCNFRRGKYIKMRNLVKMEFERSNQKNKNLQIPCLHTLLKSQSNCTLCFQKESQKPNLEWPHKGQLIGVKRNPLKSGVMWSYEKNRKERKV